MKNRSTPLLTKKLLSMILYIDTTDEKRGIIKLIYSDNLIKQQIITNPQAETFNLEIRKFLKKEKCKITEINKVAVKTGPGFFSRVRVGVVAANAIAYALNIKVVSVPEFNKDNILNSFGEKIAIPNYGAEPRITLPKKV
jgi:hypothetical protein